MFFLESLYLWLEQMFSGKINHFPLIRLVVHSLDQAFVLFFLWLGVWFSYCLLNHKKVWEQLKRSYPLLFCVFYIILLFELTVFRYPMTIFSVKVVKHTIEDIHLVPFIDSIHLLYGDSVFSILYNILGNVAWFVPLGWFVGRLSKEHTMKKAFYMGALVSLSIETLQFLFLTGVTHIDDVIWNTLGSIIGYQLYKIIKRILIRILKGENK
ncbi:Glycopeptide antibiotics resistance protein [Granulicatella balaenopterae]|uniref:Glycopeptide antibiotics resistance protein n=1 Tax=Granulicatella balaenopterae TaxID=137733 RepID=A0A1H9M6T6_9LACT|nr:VanZ family protein [Granulicatella balaenopterae]SER19342.1 Glycopeptide antibiotics resistance protein [Granulicatella balaenopterae]